MIFHENRLLADDSHEIPNLIFFRKLEKMSQNVSSAAVVIGALRVKFHFMSFSQRLAQWTVKQCPTEMLDCVLVCQYTVEIFELWNSRQKGFVT